MEMTEPRAREILVDVICDGGLDDGRTSWIVGTASAVLDGLYTADELEAIAFWMRKHAP